MSSRIGWEDLVWDDPDGGKIVLHEGQFPPLSIRVNYAHRWNGTDWHC